MKKTKMLKIFLLTAVLMVLLAFSASARNHVTDININVTLNENGSAHIYQHWTGDFDEGSECYYEFNTGNRLRIENLQVRRNGELYSTLDSWNVNAPFHFKKNACGLNKVDEDTFEVCWGIGEYGDNYYTVSYTVYNVVGCYADSDGFNFRFINSGMNTGPTNSRINISLWDGTPITDENCNIWAFGYDGEIEFNNGNGTVDAYTYSGLEERNHVTIMMEFKRGIFNSSFVSTDSFETVKEKAFDGSDYYDDTSYENDKTEIIMLIVVAVLILSCILGACGYFIARKIKKEKLIKTSEYQRQAPPKEELNKSYALLSSLFEAEESDIISARILCLIMEGAISPVDVEKKRIGKNDVSFKINSIEGKYLDPFDEKLYNILKASAGDDGLLEPLEMKKYCNYNYRTLRSFLDKSKGDGIRALNALRCSKNGSYTNIFKFTERGVEEFQKLMGFKKYLSEFSLIEERGVFETSIWQDYLVYASLFGIADKVAKELKKAYPGYVPEIERYERDIIFANTCRTHLYVNLRKTENAVQQPSVRMGGGGGRASFGGGGGFSGGGSRGGTR